MHTALMLDDTRVLIYGGRSADNAVLNDLCVLDIEKMAWVDRKMCAFPRCSHTAVYLPHSQTEELDGKALAPFPSTFSFPPGRALVSMI